ncbi:MAG: DUF4157 domain-containing protein [Acidimicrobiales bacterium]
MGTTSAIRRPIGFREHRDVTEYAVVGVVEGLARATPRATAARALPEAPIREASVLPVMTVRTLRASPVSPAPGEFGLTSSSSVTFARPAVERPGPAGAPAPGRADTGPAGESPVARHLPRQSLAQSRRLGLGPAFHGALPDAMVHDRLDRAADAEEDRPAETERVPDDLRTIMRAAYGDDVGDQLVRRGSDATEEARQLGARAFARDGEVFVPIDAGPLDEAPAKSLLAHELTHLVQQRRRSAPLPTEGSPEGRALEAEAQRSERFVRGDPGAPAPGPMTTVSFDHDADELADTQRFVSELVHRGVAEPDGSGGVRFLWGHGSGGHVQRATEPAAPATGQAGMGSRVWTAVSSTFTDDIVEAAEAPWGITTEEAEKSGGSGVDSVAREQSRQQLRDKFHSTRLEHLKSQKAQDALGGVLSEDDLATLKAQVDKEVDARLDEVKRRTTAQIDLVNKHLVEAKQQPIAPDRLDPDLYDSIYNKLFPSDVDAPIPPADDVTVLDEKAKESVAKLKAKAGAAAPGGTVPKPGAAVAPGAAAGAVTPPGGPAAPGTPKAPAIAAGAAKAEPVIDSWSDVKGSYLTEFADVATSPFGITLTDAERKQMWDPEADGKKAAATPAAAGAPGATVAPHGIEMIDLDRLDLEDLTRRLFQRVRSDLRRELLVDRERSGRLNDMR